MAQNQNSSKETQNYKKTLPGRGSPKVKVTQESQRKSERLCLRFTKQREEKLIVNDVGRYRKSLKCDGSRNCVGLVHVSSLSGVKWLVPCGIMSP